MATPSNRTEEMQSVPVELRLYKWAGQWGPFKVKIPCGECALTEDVIEDTLANELKNAEVNYTIKEWLTYWWEPLLAGGGWHAPIVLVGNKVISQGDALNRGVLAEAVIREHARRFGLSGNHVFGKDNCPHCDRGKRYLEEAGIDYQYHDVVHNPGAMYEMLARVKPIIGEKTPVTTPQIWLDGDYVGGADELGALLGTDVEPDPRRGQGSLSPPKRTSKATRQKMLKPSAA
ncbi:MAG: glutaredoxin domain-containing protein [Pseudomonadota bacterium]